MENDFGENIPIGVYRSNDDVKNLKIRISIKKVNPCDQVQSIKDDKLSEVSLRDSSSSSVKCTFRWQGKIPDQVKSQANSSNANAIDSAPINLFSYTNGNFSLEEWQARKKITRSLNCSNYLEKQNVAFAKSQMSAYFATRGCPKSLLSKKKQIIHKLDKKRAAFAHSFFSLGQFMSLMANIRSADGDDKEEIELCLLNLTADGCLIVTPDFNSNGVPYIIRTKRAEAFEYTIEHASDYIQDFEVQTEQNILSKINRQRFSRITSFEGHDVYVRPESSRFYVNGEIVSANNFESTNLHIQYQFECSEDLLLPNEQCLSGTTYTCYNSYKSKNNIAHFGYPFSLELEAAMESSNWKDYYLQGMQMFIKVVSLDLYGNQRSEGYGYCTVPLNPGNCTVTIHTWKVLPQSPFERLQHFFIGGSLHLENLRDMKFPQNKSGVLLNKYGMKTESSGFVVVKFHSLFQSK